MNYLRRFFFNLFMLVILLVALYVVLPDIMGTIYQLYYAILGPSLLLLLLVYTALPAEDESMMKINTLRELQSASGEELRRRRTLMLPILDKAFKGEL